MKTVLKKGCFNKKSWFTNGLKCACTKKKSLYKALTISQSSEAELKYKTYKNKLTSVLRCSEKTLSSTNNLTHQNTLLIFFSNKKQISENKAIANGFNNYFTNVGFSVANNISSPYKDVSIYDYLGEGCNGSIFLSPVDEQEIIRTVQKN